MKNEPTVDTKLTDVVIFLIFAARCERFIKPELVLEGVVVGAHDVEHFVNVLGATLLLTTPR